MKNIFLLFLFFGISYSIEAQKACPPYGNTTDPLEKKLNIRKNRGVTISDSKKAEFIALNELITTKKKEDQGFYKSDVYVYTEGFLVSHEEQGAETCNCGKASKTKKTGDVHMYLGLIANAPKKNCIVVEITPAYKKVHPDYEGQLTDGKKVRIFGYLIYDYKHRGQSFNTCTKCGHIWRKTCWEIHPITAIEEL